MAPRSPSPTPSRRCEPATKLRTASSSRSQYLSRLCSLISVEPGDKDQTPMLVVTSCPRKPELCLSKFPWSRRSRHGVAVWSILRSCGCQISWWTCSTPVRASWSWGGARRPAVERDAARLSTTCTAPPPSCPRRRGWMCSRSCRRRRRVGVVADGRAGLRAPLQRRGRETRCGRGRRVESPPVTQQHRRACCTCVTCRVAGPPPGTAESPDLDR